MEVRKEYESLRDNPLLYEINIVASLRELSRQYGSPVTLGNIPADYATDTTIFTNGGMFLYPEFSSAGKGV
jgi:hypothetical protein